MEHETFIVLYYVIVLSDSTRSSKRQLIGFIKTLPFGHEFHSQCCCSQYIFIDIQKGKK